MVPRRGFVLGDLDAVRSFADFLRARRPLGLTVPFTGTIIPFSSRRRIKRSLGSRLSESYRRGLRTASVAWGSNAPLGFRPNGHAGESFGARENAGPRGDSSRDRVSYQRW